MLPVFDDQRVSATLYTFIFAQRRNLVSMDSGQALITMQTFDDVKFTSREVKLIYGKIAQEKYLVMQYGKV